MILGSKALENSRTFMSQIVVIINSRDKER